MTKWVIIFLALANGFMFYVITGQSKHDESLIEQEGSSIQRIKLVSEVGVTDPDQIIDAQTAAMESQKKSKKDDCWVILGIKTERDQQSLSDFLVEQSFQPILRLPNELDRDYQIELSHRFDHKTNDAVHRLIKERYPSVKIEKKVCKGVAY